MKTFSALIAFPAHTAERGKIPVRISLLAAFLSILAFAACFQYIYPLLLNEMPFLGAFRKAATLLQEKKLFTPDLFFRGLGMGAGIYLVSLTCHLVAGIPTSSTRKGSWSMSRSLSTATGSTIPLLYTSVAGILLAHLHFSLGLLPLVGLLAGSCLAYGIFINQMKMWRNLAMFLAPVITVAQIYTIIWLLP